MKNTVQLGPNLEDVLAPYGSLDRLELVSKVGKSPAAPVINQSGSADLSAAAALSAVRAGPDPV